MKKRWIYKRIPSSLVFEEEWIDYLNDMLKDGYKLNKVGYQYLRFEEYHLPVKYQIDNTPLSDEYLEMIQDMGYIHIGHHQDMQFYYSDDLNALDLQTDEEVHKLTLLKKYSKTKMILLIILAIIFGFIAVISLLDFIPFSLGYIYSHFHQLNLSLLSLLCAFMMTLLALSIYKTRQKIMFDQPINVHHDKIMKTFLYLIYGIAFVCLILMLMNSSSFKEILFLICYNVIYWIFCYIIQHYVFQLKKESLRRWMNFVGSVFMIISITLISEYLSPSIEDITLPESFPYQEDVYQYENHLFLQKISYATKHFNRCYICYNDDIAQEVIKTLIQTFPKEERLFDEDKEESLISYDQALQYYQKYDSSLIDQCYYQQHYFIGKKGNIVIECYIDDINEIENIINDYFKEKEGI